MDMKKYLLMIVAMAVCMTISAQGFHYEPVNSGQTGKASTTTQTASQDEQKSYATTSEKKGLSRYPMEFGGNIGGSFGNNTSILISPTIGWQFTDWFAAGVGLNYIYYSEDNDSYDSYKENYAGLSVYGRARVLKLIALYMRPEANYAWGSYKLAGEKINLEKKVVPSLVLGAGFYLPIGNGSTIVSLYYDVIQDDRSPYGNNVGLSVGYTFGF
jgi:hypothetical protein